MKKHNYKAIGAASILCLAAMATSCSQELEEGKVQTENNKAELNVVKLNFATDALTRGTMYDDIAQMPDDATFGVYGYAHKDNDPANDPNFINNGSAKKKDGVVHVDGEVATYKKKMPNVQLAAVYPRLSDGNQFQRTGANTYTLTYSLQKDMAQQKDLMIGQTEEFEINEQNSTEKEISSGKTINMHHALTAINFAIGDRVPTGYTIEGILLKGLCTNGTCKVDLSKDKNVERFKWDTKNAKKDSVYIKPNHATTTKINGTQFTGLKGSDKKYDNLTVFMIPQEIDKDAVAKVYLKIEGKVKINEDKRKTKMIRIPLLTTTKTKDDGGGNVTEYKGITEYRAGEVKLYRISDDKYKTINLKETDVKLYVNPLKIKDVENYYNHKLDSNYLKNKNAYIYFNKETSCEKVKDQPHTYKVYIESSRYAGDSSGKVAERAEVAPQTFKIKRIKYEISKDTYTDLPEGSWKAKVVKQPEGYDRVGAFTLTFHPEKFPPELSKRNAKIYIVIVLDGFEKTELQIKGKGFPTA